MQLCNRLNRTFGSVWNRHLKDLTDPIDIEKAASGEALYSIIRQKFPNVLKDCLNHRNFTKHALSPAVETNISDLDHREFYQSTRAGRAVALLGPEISPQ